MLVIELTTLWSSGKARSNIMNWTLLNVYSDVYTVALLRNVSLPMENKTVDIRPKSRISKLAKLFHRA
jgi:hypothetical protein